ncbi:MAG: glycosyltransferase family 4 protein [Actinomycetota bacterium]
MKILIVTHYFPPETGAPQTRLGELARMWTENGDEVTVLTGFPNHPTGVITAPYRRKARMVEPKDGYRIIRTWLYATPNERVIRKTLGHLSFMVSSVVLGIWSVGRTDVVIVSSPTMFSVPSAWFIAAVKRSRLVVEIRDLWPKAIVELGVLTSRKLIGALEILERWCYRVADLVVPVTAGLRDDIVARGVQASKVFVITNGVDTERFSIAQERADLKAQLGATNGELLALYIGTHGMIYDLDAIIDAAEELRDEPIRFAFVGEGVTKAGLMARVRDAALDNVMFHPSVDAAIVPDVMRSADIGLIPLRDVPLVDSVLPVKMFEYMAAGRPIVAAIRGESEPILQLGGAVIVPPEDRTAFVEALRMLARDSAQRGERGEQGRAYVSANHSRRRLAETYRTLLT